MYNIHYFWISTQINSHKTNTLELKYNIQLCTV